MLRTLIASAFLPLALLSTSALPAAAQEDALRKRIVKRVVEPVPFWIDASKLQVRDDPFGGNALSELERGQQVKVYEQLENWMRISAEGQDPRWINGDYTSAIRVTWANYANGGASKFKTHDKAVRDIDLRRIPVEDGSSSKIFAANVKALDSRRRVVDTRHNTEDGRYYERYLVQCASNKASHARLLGEGYSYVRMHKDPRNEYLNDPLDSVDKLEGSSVSADRRAIASFACSARS